MEQLLQATVLDATFQQLLSTVFTMLLTGLLAAALKYGRAFMLRRLSVEQLRLLTDIATFAVNFAEQTGLDKTGEQKKAEALKVASDFLAKYGLKVTPEQLDAAIEAALYEATKPAPAVSAPV